MSGTMEISDSIKPHQQLVTWFSRRLLRVRKACPLTAFVASKSAGMLSTNSGVSVTSVGVAMFTFGQTVFTVTLGWTISSA